MPWREVKPMDEKVLFIADYLRSDDSMTMLCQRYGISRKTGYKWVNRYHAKGMDGLREQSREPQNSPTKTPYVVRKAIVEIRKKRGRIGAKKLRVLLAKQFPEELIPSKTTINNILTQEGLVLPNKKRNRVSPYAQPFAPVNAPNELWSADFKGQFKTRNGRWCYPLTVMDHDSRFLLGCEGLDGTRFRESKAVFEQLFREYGLPHRVRTDNGVPFASRAAGGLSSLSVWWIRLGIMPERIKPGRPQQNGRHERMHRTLKQAVTRPPAASRSAQQKRFDEFCQDYNYERPHEALNQSTPASRYRPSLKPYPEKLPELEYPSYFEIKKISSHGIAYWRGRYIYISHLLIGETIGMSEVDDGIWDVYFGHLRIGIFDERDMKGRSVPYITIKKV